MKKTDLINCIKELEREIDNKGAVISNLYAKEINTFRYNNKIGFTDKCHLTHYRYLKVGELNRIYEFINNFIETL